MPKLTIEVEVEEVSCCVCTQKTQLTPVGLVFEPPFHDTTLPPRWRVTSRIYPVGWNHVGSDLACPKCWGEFLEFAAAKRPRPLNP